MSYIIRLIELKDNNQIAAIIRNVLTEFGCVGPGWGSSDAEVDFMFEAYQDSQSRYFVIEESQSNKILGGGGFAPLKDEPLENKICEMRKVYLLSESRGMGAGKKLIEKILASATEMGFKEMYLETTAELSQAVELYQRLGFQTLSAPKGNTGHQGKCKIFMNRSLLDNFVN